MSWLNVITDSMDMFEQTLGDNEGQGILACCSPWGGKELDMTKRLNNNNRVELLSWLLTGLKRR